MKKTFRELKCGDTFYRIEVMDAYIPYICKETVSNTRWAYDYFLINWSLIPGDHLDSSSYGNCFTNISDANRELIRVLNGHIDRLKEKIKEIEKQIETSNEIIESNEKDI